LATPLQAKTSGAQRQPNSETTRDDEAERIESDFVDKDNKHPKKGHERPESENELQESGHGKNAPDDQDDDNGCICKAHGTHGPGGHARGTESTFLEPNA
jgi:hypothetical protein